MSYVPLVPLRCGKVRYTADSLGLGSLPTVLTYGTNTLVPYWGPLWILLGHYGSVIMDLLHMS